MLDVRSQNSYQGDVHAIPHMSLTLQQPHLYDKRVNGALQCEELQLLQWSKGYHVNEREEEDDDHVQPSRPMLMENERFSAWYSRNPRIEVDVGAGG